MKREELKEKHIGLPIFREKDFDEIWKAAQKDQQIWDLYQMIDILKDGEYDDGTKIYKIQKQIEDLTNI